MSAEVNLADVIVNRPAQPRLERVPAALATPSLTLTA
jgi:hypothetical protein